MRNWFRKPAREERLEADLDKLPFDQMVAVMLYGVQGFTPEEVALSMELSDTEAVALIAGGLDTLRQLTTQLRPVDTALPTGAISDPHPSLGRFVIEDYSRRAGSAPLAEQHVAEITDVIAVNQVNF